MLDGRLLRQYSTTWIVLLLLLPCLLAFIVPHPRPPILRPKYATTDPIENDDDIVPLDDRLYRVRLSRATGIDWGTDLSFSFVYIRDLDPTESAALSGVVQKGDQLCELRAVADDAPTINLVGAPFDAVMNAFAQLDRTVSEVDLVFFRGTKNELKALATGGDEDGTPDTITVTVLQQDANNSTNTTTLTAPAGVNLRQLLVDNRINVYQSLTRWTNCRGKQLCGTCIVDVINGEQQFTNRKSMDEASTLRENPGTYRLSCVTFAYGNVTVRTLPPIGAAQWTR